MPATDPRQCLLDLSHARGVSLATLSSLIGRNGAYLQQFVRRGSPRKLEEGDRYTLAQFLGVDEARLREPQGFSSAAAADWVDIPRLALGASAGRGVAAGDERPIGALRFSQSWLRAQQLSAAALSTIAVDGDSMERTLHDGDEILVDRAPRVWRDGVHVVRAGDALLVKRLDLARPGMVSLISDNPVYPRIDLPHTEVTIIGRVVWKSGRV